MAEKNISQMAYDERQEECTCFLRYIMLSLTLFDWVLYFSGHEGIRVLFKGKKAGTAAEIVQPILIIGTGIIGWFRQFAAAGSIEFR